MMKKYINLTLMLLGIVLFSSCEKEDIPMTNTIELAGEWAMTIDVIDGDEVYEDGYELGPNLWITYNTNADNGKEIWVDNLAYRYFPYKTKIKVSCDLNTLTFGDNSATQNVYFADGVTATLRDGKIIKNGAVTPSGMPADKIEFYITYSNDRFNYLFYVHGYRRTGFEADGL